MPQNMYYSKAFILQINNVVKVPTYEYVTVLIICDVIRSIGMVCYAFI